MSIMAKTPSGYKKIGSAYLGERPVDKVFNTNGDVVYALQRELTGGSPLLFKGKEQSELLNYRIYGDTETKQRDYSGSSPLTVPVHDGELYNYRIYGNTANGESLGEKTANLFDMKKFAELCYPRYASVTFADNTLSFTSTDVDAYVNIVHGEGATVAYEYRPSCIDVLPSTTYTISMSSAPKCYISWVDSSYKTVSAFTRIPANQSSYTFTTPSNCTKLLIRLGKEVTNIGDTFTISNIMLNSGSTALPYEPYGYKVPIAVTNSGTTSNETIYLPEPIKMVGSEAEYVDFYSQKQYFADGTSTAISVPALPISTGTNTVTVNTTVQPSSVEVSVDENVSVGDLVTSGQHAGEYKVSVTVSNGTDTLTTPIYLPEPIKMVGDEAEYIDYAEQKMHRVRKNLLNEEYIQGNPISNSIIRVKCKTPIPLVKGELYTISFDSGSLFDVSISSSPTPEYPFASDNTILSYCGNPLNWLTSPYTFECVNDGYISVAIRKKDNTSITPDEVNFAIQFEKNSTATSYEPYIENVDLDVTLPALPTIKGTNEMSVDTEVQPSRMDIKGRIKSLT